MFVRETKEEQKHGQPGPTLWLAYTLNPKKLLVLFVLFEFKTEDQLDVSPNSGFPWAREIYFH